MGNRMVHQDRGELNAVFMALAEPTRRAIVARLAEGEASVSELAAPFAMSPRWIAMRGCYGGTPTATCPKFVFQPGPFRAFLAVAFGLRVFAYS
jgi:hypothetical protein